MCGKYHTPTAKGARLVSFLVNNWLFVEKGKNTFTKIALAAKLVSISWNSFFSDTIYRGVWIFFFQLNLLPTYCLHSQGDNIFKNSFCFVMTCSKPFILLLCFCIWRKTDGRSKRQLLSMFDSHFKIPYNRMCNTFNCMKKPMSMSLT